MDIRRGFCPAVARLMVLPSAGPFFLALALALAVCLAAGCAFDAAKARLDLNRQAAAAGFQPVDFQAGPFTLAGLLKKEAAGNGQALVVYLEGDGQAVLGRRVSPDPTPRSAGQAYKLAAADPASLVLYLARIGQYQPGQTGRSFQKYWAEKRLSEEAVEAAGQALDQAESMTGATGLHLVGYSGGGGLAALLAERRGDVLSLVTVAGLLDTDYWVRAKNYKPLAGLNPGDQAGKLAGLPQVHFYGEKDAIIPPEMSLHFQGKASFSNFRRVAVPGNHWSAWTGLWPKLLREHLLPLRAVAPDKPVFAR